MGPQWNALLQIQNHAQWLASAGFTCTFNRLLNLERWDSIPAERGKSYLTAKLGCALRY